MKEMILAVGNTMRGDDGISSYIVEQVNKSVNEADGKTNNSTNILKGLEKIAIDCGTIPENYTSVIRKYKPDILVLIDAAEMGLTPGSYRIVAPERIGVMTISTHGMPLSLFVSYVKQFCKTVLLLGVQPRKMDFSENLSPELYIAGDEIAKIIVSGKFSDITEYHP